VPNAQLFILAVVVVTLVSGHAVEQEHLTSHGAYEYRYLTLVIYCVYAMPNSRFHFAISADSCVHKRQLTMNSTWKREMVTIKLR